MKNRKIIVLLLCVLTLTTGCGNKKYILDEDNKPIKYSETGQFLQKNILCQPGDEELYKLYKDNNDQMDISVDKLPKCDDYKINSNKSTGLWEFLFVKPLALILLFVGKLINNYGLSVILVGIIIRLIVLPFSYKSQKQSRNMQKANPELQRIEKKYRNKTDQASMMAKSQETMMIYKKYKINPMSGCLLAFIQLPIFFAFWQALNRIPAIFEDKLLGLNLGMTPAQGISNGIYAYIILLILIALSTYFSFKYSMSSNPLQNEEMKKQTDMMVKIMTVMIIFTSLSLSTALSLYWITTYAFIAIQTYIFKKLLNNNEKNSQSKSKNGKIKEKLKIKEGMKYGKNN